MTVEVAPLDAGHMYQAAMVRRVALWHALPHLRDVHTPEEDEAYWRTHLLAEYTVLGAFVDGGLAGVIAYGNGWIEQLYVLPDVQGMGIGTRFLSLAVNDMNDIRLWTFQQNRRARAFYEARGFSSVEKTDGSGNEEGEPDVLYHWRRLPEPVYSADPLRR
ncbi:GNAT superfamily N-acetyltransferase [Rhizobium sp. BK275]|uniref:GNAT family N-acetyltransferase n=1 Tax=Rhizobium sp. BK275 TaxID=2587077 RepID=UPI00161E353F|nr:GNAT family N-acetyltransferase [Rhizobium sp. BK275]MBB3392267.1 GNAT superfamily N-acetyltransferase [Rhizobium sp. BK275]